MIAALSLMAVALLSIYWAAGRLKTNNHEPTTKKRVNHVTAI